LSDFGIVFLFFEVRDRLPALHQKKGVQMKTEYQPRTKSEYAVPARLCKEQVSLNGPVRAATEI
jgi:hypothetical protein